VYAGAEKLDPMKRRWGDVRVGNVIENKEVCVKLILAITNIKGGERRAKGVSTSSVIRLWEPSSA
jgi:hypothetical protein